MGDGDENGTTKLFKVVDDDVVLMHGQVWRVREKGIVRIEELTDPQGAPLGPTNWRCAYVGACGMAAFADDAMGGALSVAQVRFLSYPGEEGALRPTHDILRTSSGVLVEQGDAFTLVTRRTRYVFRRLVGDEAASVQAAIDGFRDLSGGTAGFDKI